MVHQEYDLAFTHLKNNQNISAHNKFFSLAESLKKSAPEKAALLYTLAAEAKARQGKDNETEITEAANLYLKIGKKDTTYLSKLAFLCASKCFLRVGKFSEAKKAYDKAKTISIPTISITRPVVIIDDSKAITMKLKHHLQKLGYDEIFSYSTGKSGIQGCKKLLTDSKNPIVLLDMSLPDIDGDAVASKLLDEKLDLQIIIITADEKTTERVSKTISTGVSAFIQKPFTMEDIKHALDVAESEYS